jgi:hypothetical protein
VAELGFGFPKAKLNPVSIKSELPQTVRLKVEITEQGFNITLKPRHIDDPTSIVLPTGQTAYIEDDDAKD